MKCLSLTQPWAALLFAPKLFLRKTFETRSFQTSHRGVLAIHASKSYPRWARRLCFEEPFIDALAEDGWTHVWDEIGQLPLGVVLGTVEVVAMHRTEDIRDRLSANELAFGDYSDGRFAWELANPVLFPTPIPAKGSLGLWTCEPPVDELA